MFLNEIKIPSWISISDLNIHGLGSSLGCKILVFQIRIQILASLEGHQCKLSRPSHNKFSFSFTFCHNRKNWLTYPQTDMLSSWTVADSVHQVHWLTWDRALRLRSLGNTELWIDVQYFRLTSTGTHVLSCIQQQNERETIVTNFLRTEEFKLVLTIQFLESVKIPQYLVSQH